MADMVTAQELENAKIDARTIGEAVNENKIVTPRYGTPFKSMPMIAEEMQSVIGTIIAGGVPASIVLDASGKSQQVVNDSLIKRSKSILFFNNDFDEAAAWVQESTSNYLELFAETYELNKVGVQYLNRVYCKNGTANLIISASTNLTYSLATSDNVLSIDGVRFIILGHRQGDGDNSFNSVYITDQNTHKLKTSSLKNIQVYALQDVEDLGSYVDDAGKTRGFQFITYQVSEKSCIDNIVHYGLRAFAGILSASNIATHYDSNVTGYNAETGIYFWPTIWGFGESTNQKIINTAIQQGYWVGKSAGASNNGKDVIVNAANYNDRYIVDNIYAKYAIERSIYIQSDKAIVSNIVDEFSYSMGHMKKSPIITPSGSGNLSNISANSVSNTGTVLQAYGYSKIDLTDVSYNSSVNNLARWFTFTNNTLLNLSNAVVKNVGELMIHMTGGSSGVVNISDLTAINCYSSVSPYLFRKYETNTETIDELNISDLKLVVDPLVNPSNIFTNAIDLGGVNGVKKLSISDSEIDISRSLLSYGSGTTEIKLNKVNLNVRTNSTITSIFSNMLLAGLSPLSASTFDITVNISSKDSSVSQVKTSIQCSKSTNIGIVKCLDYWNEINFEIPVVDAVAIGYVFMQLGAVSYFVEAEFAGSILRYFYDASTNTITEQVNAGGKLGTGARNAAKITLKTTQASNYRFDIDVGQTTWTGGAGTLKVKLYR